LWTEGKAFFFGKKSKKLFSVLSRFLGGARMTVQSYAGMAILGLLLAVFGAIGKSTTGLAVGLILLTFGAYQVLTTPSGLQTVRQAIFTLST